MLLDLLEKIKVELPHLRYGQIIAIASHGIDVFYISDEELLLKLKEFYEESVKSGNK